MTTEETISLIKRYATIDDEIRLYQNQLSDLYCSLLPSGCDLDGLPKGSGTSDPTANMGIRIAENGDGDHIREIEACIEELRALRSDVFHAFIMLPYYQLMTICYYYLEGKRWVWISRKIGYSVRQCINIRDAAIKTLSKKFDDF